MVQAGHQNEQQLLKVFSSKLMDIYYKSTSQKGKKKSLALFLTHREFNSISNQHVYWKVHRLKDTVYL